MFETGTYRTTTAPATEPLSVSDVKNYLKVDFSTDDTLIALLIAAAREAVEKYCQIALIEQTITEKFPKFQGYGLRLSVAPLLAVTGITYRDSNGTTQTLSTDLYGTFPELRPPMVYRKFGKTLPTVQPGFDSVTAVYTAGYANAAAVPAPIRQAILLMIADWYDNRADGVRNMPTASQALLNAYRVNVF